MLRHALVAKPSIIALMVAAIVLIACSLARAAGQSFVNDAPVVAAVLTFLVFLIPGVVAGVIAPRSFLWDGLILGMIAAAFVTFQSLQFRVPNWSSIVLYEAIGVWACVSAPLCIVGALGGRFVRLHR
jgi:p-aminobenzoyl-glutamate transporter AbgT